MPEHRALLCALAAWMVGCASLPTDRAERNLYLDLRKAVELSEDTDWIVDAVELDANAEDALHSVCQVPPDRRANLSAWLGGQIMAAGGAARSQFESTGSLDGAGEALTLERVRALLDYADARAANDCPFWLPPIADFDGVQGPDGQPLILLESIGGGRAILEGEDIALGGGGGGRILVGYAFDRRYTLVSGVELGGAGSFVENDTGGQTIETLFTGAMPLMLRMNDDAIIYDVELAVVTPLLSGGAGIDPSARATFGVGLGTMRRATFMPYLVMWVGYEVTPPRGDADTSHMLLLGSRVGVDWVP